MSVRASKSVKVRGTTSHHVGFSTAKCTVQGDGGGSLTAAAAALQHAHLAMYRQTLHSISRSVSYDLSC